jgi:DNA polymerase I-like protein with 3'-5' exonuclease and polymerase domains
MNNVHALDIETECNVTDCPGVGGSHRCRHALNPFTSRISLIAIYGPNIKHVFDNISEFEKFILTEAPKDISFVGHGFAFDIKQLSYHWNNAILLYWSDDTMLMAHTYSVKIPDTWLESYSQKRIEKNKLRPLTPHRSAKKLSLKTLAPYFLEVDAFWEPEHHTDIEYALKDAEYTYRLYLYFQKQMSSLEKDFYVSKQMPWAKMLVAAEMRGIQLDKNKHEQLTVALREKEQQLREELDQTWQSAHAAYRQIEEKKLHAKYVNMAHTGSRSLETSPRYQKLYDTAKLKLPIGFDYDSPQQMQWFLREHEDLNITNFKGDDSSGKAVLERLAAEGRSDIGKYLEWRKTQKLLTAFLPQYKELSAYDGAIHTNFHAAGTRTGRLSSSEPNLQQVNKKLKPLFIPRPGHKFIIYDLSAIEARLIAWYSEDAALFNIIQKGWSIHDYNAKIFFNLSCQVEEVKKNYPRERAAAKRVGFSLFYGAAFARIQDALLQEGFSITPERSKQMLENFRSEYRGSFNFHKEITLLFEKGEVIENALGRPLKIQPWENPYMQGYNTLIQSTASDINIQCLYKANLEYNQKGIPAFPLLLIHDAVVIEVKEEQAIAAEQILLNQYKKFNLVSKYGTIPIEVEGGIYDEWR